MENIPMCKAILVGEVNTGKTCIIRQFVENKFNQFSKPQFSHLRPRVFINAGNAFAAFITWPFVNLS